MIVLLAPGARLNASGASASAILASASVIPLTVTFPLFVTTTVYVTVAPATTPLVGFAVFVTSSPASTVSVYTVSLAV